MRSGNQPQPHPHAGHATAAHAPSTQAPSAPAPVGQRMLPSPAVTDRSLVDEARATHRAVGKTFWLASRLLPRGVRDDVHLLYLVLRSFDDAVDEHQPNAEEMIAGGETWARTGRIETREARILADLATRHTIDRTAVADFCAGMRDDMEGGRTLATEYDVDTYCYRVAGTVGLLMTGVLGARDPHLARRPAVALGQAMQRTNILRDIDEDLAAGRVYIASETIERFGSLHPGERSALLVDQIARADALFDEGLAGVRYLATGGRAIAAAGAMYREILREIERDGLGASPGRAVVPLPRKIGAAIRVQRGLRA